MSLRNIIILYLMLMSTAIAVSERNLFSGAFEIDELKEVLVDKDEFRPIPGYKERNIWGNLPESLRNRILEEAEKALHFEWLPARADMILDFFETGDRQPYQDVSYSNRNALWNLVRGELVEGEGRFIRQIINGVWHLSEESVWAIPAHLDQWYDDPTLPDPSDPYVDTIAAETASLFAWTYYFLKEELDAVSPVISQRIYREVNRRVFEPALNLDHWWMGFDTDRRRPNNWNPWICSNWLTAVLILEPDTERRAAMVHRISKALDMFTNPYPADGGCDEGPMYWALAAASLFDNIQLLNAATSGAFDVYDNLLIINMGTYVYKMHIAGDYVVNFADSRPTLVRQHGGVIYRYGKAIGDQTMMGYGTYAWDGYDYFPAARRKWRNLNDFLYYQEVRDHPIAEPLILESWLPDIEVMTARSKANSTEGFFVGAKGGHNDESHNHNDIGNFVVYHDGEPVLIDVGHGTYTRRTFGPRRYEVWFNRSEYHNVPTINGIQQKPGPEFKARDAKFESSDTHAQITLDIAGAYPEEAGVDQWLRIMRLNRSESIELMDEIKLSRREQVIYNFMTIHRVEEIYPGLLRLKRDGHPNVMIEYSPRQFYWDWKRLSLDQAEDGTVVNNWGEEIYRLQLIMDQPRSKESVQVTIFEE